MPWREAMPEAEKLVRISRQFGVSTDYLLLEELEEPETASTTAPAAGLWVRVKQWYRNRSYLLAWVLAAWGCLLYTSALISATLLPMSLASSSMSASSVGTNSCSGG